MSSGTAVDVHVYCVPSVPDRPYECRDTAAVSGDRTAFALCDGASAAYRAGPWGGLLASAYIAEAPDHARESVAGWVERCRSRWSEQEARRKEERTGVSFWVADAEARNVAATTLLGLKLRSAPEGLSYEAVAVGDTCLLHVREDKLLCAFPLDDSSLFGSHPDLITTRANGTPGLPGMRSCRRPLAARDMILLVSDALAQVLLARAGTDGDPEAALWWEVVRRLDATSFARLVTDLRSARIIETDDTTLIRICPRTP